MSVCEANYFIECNLLRKMKEEKSGEIYSRDNTGFSIVEIRRHRNKQARYVFKGEHCLMSKPELTLISKRKCDKAVVRFRVVTHRTSMSN